jgi:hypothetical protein
MLIDIMEELNREFIEKVGEEGHEEFTPFWFQSIAGSNRIIFMGEIVYDSEYDSDPCEDCVKMCKSQLSNKCEYKKAGLLNIVKSHIGIIMKILNKGWI